MYCYYSSFPVADFLHVAHFLLVFSMFQVSCRNIKSSSAGRSPALISPIQVNGGGKNCRCLSGNSSWSQQAGKTPKLTWNCGYTVLYNDFKKNNVNKISSNTFPSFFLFMARKCLASSQSILTLQWVTKHH